jgi:hypothetical protein
VFYGWVMVAVAFVTQFVSSGVIFYTFGIALKEWTVEFESGRFGVSGIHFVLPWAGAAIAPFVGRWASAGHLRLLVPGRRRRRRTRVLRDLAGDLALAALRRLPGADGLCSGDLERCRRLDAGRQLVLEDPRDGPRRLADRRVVRRDGHGAAHGLALRRPWLARRLSRIRARDPRPRSPARLADRRSTRRSRPAARRHRRARDFDRPLLERPHRRRSGPPPALRRRRPTALSLPSATPISG